MLFVVIIFAGGGGIEFFAFKATPCFAFTLPNHTWWAAKYNQSFTGLLPVAVGVHCISQGHISSGRGKCLSILYIYQSAPHFMSFFAISQGTKYPFSSLPPMNHSIETRCLILLMSCQGWSFGVLTRVISLVKLNPLVEKMVPAWIRLVRHIQQVLDRLGSGVWRSGH